MKNLRKLFAYSLFVFAFSSHSFSQTLADSALVTFQVDMNAVTNSFTTPEVNGTFNNWCGDCWSMTDSNNDNVWEISGMVLKNTPLEFKFSADGWGIQENLFPGDPCTVTAWGYTNRTLNVSNDTTLDVVCWESCGPCGGAPSAYNVTFQVDMNGVSGFTIPEVNGTFNNWCGSCWQMSDNDGDNVWDFTTLLAPGIYDFKYSADNWNIQESLDSSLWCVNTVIDTTLPSGYAANRSFEVISSDITLDVVPWNQCEALTVVNGCTDNTANNYDVLATADDGSCMYDVTFTVDLNCAGLTPNNVSATGPSDNWSCGAYPLSDTNFDGVWEGTFSLPAGSFEYIYCADGWAASEAADLLASGTSTGDWSCTPVTDYFSFANRLITVGAVITNDTWGSCGACIPPTITSYTIDAGGYYYTPTSLNINIGDTVTWYNNGGYHDVNGDINSQTGSSFNNPASFYIPPVVGPAIIGSHIFTTAGTYNYDCSIGSHASFGMIGTIIVNSNNPVLSQIDLPVSWDDVNVDYTTTDFGGAASSLVLDPTNATNNVLQIDRTAGSQTWAGTTLGTPTGFATDIPLTLTSSTMSVTFWSPQAGVQVRLKVEDSSDPTHTCETEATTTVANGWNTLVFDFSNEAPGTQPLSIGLGFGWTFNMASIFCDFGNSPGSSTIYYVDDVVFGGVAVVSGCTDPTANNYDATATVDDGSCSYGQSTYDVTLSVNTANITVGSNGMYAGGGVLGDAVAVPLSDPNGTGTWTGVVTLPAGTVGNYIFLNSPANGGDWGAKEDLSGQACADPNNFNDRVMPAILADTTLLHCFGSCESDGTCSVYGCTDIAANNYDATATVDDGSCLYGPVLSQIDLPVSWDDVNVDYTTTDFGGAASSLVLDPTNATNNVLQIDRTAGSQTWAGTTLGTPTGFATDIPLTLTSSTMSVTFWSPQAGVQVRLKVEDSSDPTHTCETEATTTVANGWNTLVFDFSNEAPGTQPLSIGLGFGWTFNMASIFCDFGNSPGSSTIYYVDDVVFGGVAVVSGCTDPTANNYDATATVDDGSCSYGQSTYDVTLSVNTANITVGSNGMYAGGGVLGDAVAVPLSDPNGTGTWTGVVTLPAGTVGNYIFLNSPANGGDWGAKEDLSGQACADPNNFNDRVMPAILADTTLLHCFGSCESDGTCSVYGCTDIAANNYDATATVDDGSCLYGPVLSQIDLPVSWDDVNVDYTTTDFGGAASSLVLDPTNATNNVLQIDRTAGSQTWAGTTLGTPTGFATDIPLTLTSSTMSVTFWSPQAGVQVRLKVEDSSDPTHTCETEATTTVANGWNTLVFDFSNEAPGTQPLSIGLGFGWTFNMASIFCDFGNSPGSSTIYYVDDVVFGSVAVVSGCTDPTANNYDATATVDDGSCIYNVSGCTDPTAVNYDPAANVDDGSCIPVVLGCTDPLAVNYNATVNTDDGSCLYSGCTDPAASNYDANATIDDGSCSYGPSLCAGSAITGLSVSDIIHDRATFNFDNMNTYDATGAQVCRVDQIRIKYRPVGTSSWSQKNMAQPTGYDAVTGICNSTQNTAKITRNLMSSTTYEWEVKVWYCDGQNSGFVAGPNFTTADDCPNVGNLTAVGANPTMATFAWDNSNGAYSFVRLKARVDSISNPTGSDFFQIGGAGVSYGIYTKNKQNMVPGETYRGQARTYCDPNGGPYRSPSWSPLVFWTQPTVRIEGGISIANLDVYPNPSRDVFNVAFTSEDVQDLEVRVINVVGEVVYTESLQQFVGEYTKLIDLAENTKGVYFLEITTNTGVVNKKLMLQ